MTVIIAHRGARSLAPENTLLAAQKGYEAGAALWETDVNVTRDGHLVLFHDDTLVRTTNAEMMFPDAGRFLVSDFDLDQILTLDAGSWFVHTDPFGQIRDGAVAAREFSSFRKLRVPTLTQGLELTRRLQWRVNIELKKCQADHRFRPVPEMVIQAIEDSTVDPDHVIISSFYHPWLETIQRTAPEITVQALINNLDSINLSAEPFDTYNIFDPLVDETLIRCLKNAGKQINVYTVNDPDRVDFLTRAGVDGIFTDFPQWFV